MACLKKDDLSFIFKVVSFEPDVFGIIAFLCLEKMKLIYYDSGKNCKNVKILFVILGLTTIVLCSEYESEC